MWKQIKPMVGIILIFLWSSTGFSADNAVAESQCPTASVAEVKKLPPMWEDYEMELAHELEGEVAQTFVAVLAMSLGIDPYANPGDHVLVFEHPEAPGYFVAVFLNDCFIGGLGVEREFYQKTMGSIYEHLHGKPA